MQFQVMETLGNLSPMPDDVGEEQVEKMRETFDIFYACFPHFFQWRGRSVIIIACLVIIWCALWSVVVIDDFMMMALSSHF